jgi:hypothetical protein
MARVQAFDIRAAIDERKQPGRTAGGKAERIRDLFSR